MAHTPRRGFTLAEFLVVFAIIAVLLGLLLPAMRTVREPANRMKCQNNLKQLMLGVHNFHDPNGHLPPGCVGPSGPTEERLSWVVELLPYIEQDALRTRFDLTQGYTGSNQQHAAVVLQVLRCSSASLDPGTATTTYIAAAGLGVVAPLQPRHATGNGAFGYDRVTSFKDIKDGLSVTIALMETRYELGPWARGGFSTTRGFEPADLPFFGEGRPFAGHKQGMNVAMMDGTVRFLKASCDPARLAASITIHGNEDHATFD